MHFLFLQGGYSSFFNRVADALAERGHRVTGVNFCAGDQWLWRGKETINYRGRLADWAAFIADYFDRHQVTDLLLLGEQRDYHKEAVAAAQHRGIRVTVTDFGYLRPDWIALERDGMGGNSHFPRDPQKILALAETMPPVDHRVLFRDRLMDMAKGDLIYSFANVLFRFLYPHYRRSDHRAHPVLYFPFLGWQLLHAGRRQRRAMAELHRVLQKGGDFYVFPMQLDHDFQIQAYSPFDGMDQAIGYIVESFARCAPSETKLLVKVHPWDPGFVNWRRCVRRWARKYGIERRVLYFHGGSLERMAQRSRGMVTVNSTSGIQALRHGTSLICLGEAIFDTPGLTFQHGLDRFWREAPPPSAELFDAFERLLAGSILLKGVFYSEPGLTAAVRSAVERLLDPDSFQFTGQAGEAPPSGEASAR